MLARVETVVKDYAEHKFPGGKTITLGLAQDGVGLSPMKFTKDKVPAATLAKVDDMKKKILSGEIKVWNAIGTNPSFLNGSSTAAQGSQSVITLPFSGLTH